MWGQLVAAGDGGEAASCSGATLALTTYDSQARWFP